MAEVHWHIFGWPGFHFTKDFSIVIQIRLKNGFSRAPLRSCYKILHMPRQHSYRTMWNISWRSLHYNLDESKIEFPSNNDREIVREMGPSRPQVNPCDTNPVSVRSFTNMSAHYSDVMMSEMASQITGVSIAYLTVCFRRRSKKTSKLRVTGLCEGNSQVIGEFPTQMASNAENASIWWRYHKTFWFELLLLITAFIHIFLLQILTFIWSRQRQL